MRYYGVTHGLKDGRPWIEAEATSPMTIADLTEPLTREQLEADPALRKALQDWERKDDSMQAIDHAAYVIETYGLGIFHGAREAEEAVELAQDVTDDPWCDALRQALPHLKEAATIIEPMVTAVQERLRVRGVEARAEAQEDQKAEPPESV